jgi:hypothetical protein
MLVASEGIARRNVAAIEPDRIQTRSRDDGARPGFATIKTGLDSGDRSCRRAILIGTLTWAYHVVVQRNNGHPDLHLT